MTQSLATNTDASDTRRLDPYIGGLSDETPRVDALAVISAGYRARSKEGDKPGLPQRTRPTDAEQIHLHDPYGRAPGLAAALAATGGKSLQIAFPLDTGFIIQRFTRYSASRLEVYGDDASVTEIIGGPNPEHRTWAAGTAEYERIVKTCKADTRIYFCLAEWGPNGPEVVFPDGLGVYAIRTTSRHSVRSIMGTLAYTKRFTHGGIAGIPFLLSLDHREVAGPDGSKRTVPVWTITTKPPEGARLSSRTFRALATSALREGQQLMLAAPDPRTLEEMEADGPPVVDEPSEDEVQILERGGLCDYEHWIKTWHALARGSAFDSEAARAAFIDTFTEGRTNSLSDYLRLASEDQAAALIAALGEAVSNARRQSLAARQEQIFGSFHDAADAKPAEPAPAAQQHPPRIPPLQPSTGELVPVKPRQRTREELFAKYQELFKQAQDIGIPVEGPTYYADETTPREELIGKGKTLSSLVAAHPTPEPAR